jgi:hypothetical protein
MFSLPKGIFLHTNPSGMRLRGREEEESLRLSDGQIEKLS